MIKNKIHYQITGDISTDYGSIVTNPIIKVEQVASDSQVLNTETLQFEYNIYVSSETYTNGKYFFKAEKDGKRLVNFSYSISNVPGWSWSTYKEEQRQVIADTFGFDLSNVLLIEEQEEEQEEA